MIKAIEVENIVKTLLDYLETNSGELVLKAMNGKLPLYAIDNMLQEEKDMVLYLLILRKHLHSIGDK